MIHHTYSSSIISIRTSFSINEYSYYSNERCPSSYCSCCCSFPINSSRFIVPINPSFLYGLRQSTLIQCPPSRRLILGSGDRYCFRSPVSDVGLCCNGECCCVRRERVDRLLGKSCKEKCCSKNMSANVNVNVNRIRDRIARRNYRCSALGDAEAMLSLLTEETVEQCLDVRGRRWRSSKDGNVIRKQNGVCEDSRDRKENSRSGYLGGRSGRHRLDLGEIKYNEEVNKRREEREVLLKEERGLRRKESGTGNLGSLLDKVQRESSNVQSRKEDYRRREEDREDVSREEERWSRRTESGSSYYSASDTSDLESDTEVEIQDERLVEEASVRHGKDSTQMGSVVIEEERKEELRRHRDERDQQMQRNAHDDDFRVGSSVAWNSKEKSEGIVFSNEAKRESGRNRDERNHQQLQSNKHDDIRVGNVTEWDWRNKSEKRLTEESAEETKLKDSVVRHSQMSQTHKGSSMKASRPEKQFNYQEEGSSSGGSFHEQFRSHIEKDNQVSELSKSSARHEQYTQTARHNVEATSNIQRRSNLGEQGIVVAGQSVQETGCKYCKSCGRTVQQNKTQTGFQQMAELSEICDDARWTSTVQSESESRLRKQEKSSTSLQTSVQEQNNLLDQMRRQHYSETVDTHDNYVEDTSSSQQQSDAHMKNLEQNSSSLILRHEVKGSQKKSGRKVSKEIESSRVAQTGISGSQVHSTNVEINRQSASEQHYSETVYAHDNYAEDTSSSQQQSDTHMKNLQEISSSVILQEVKRLQGKSGRKVIKEIESSRVAQTGISASQVHSTNVEINCQSASKQRISDEQIYSTKVKSVEELIEKREHIDETIVQSRVRAEVQRPIVEVTYAGNLSGEATVSQPSIALISQIGVQQVSEGEASITRNDSGGITQVGPASVYISPQARTPSSSNEVSRGSGSYEEPSCGDSLGSAERMEESSVQVVGGFIEDMRHEASTQDSKLQVETGSLYTHPQARSPSSVEVSESRSESYEESSHEYALVSAERMEESSVQIVGEFVEKMQHEASTSQSTHQDEKYMFKESTQSDSEKTMFQKQESRRSSGSSETKGPSDDMWDAKDHFAQESSERDSSKSTTSENVTMRTGKSMWNIVAGILRLQSSSNAETQKSSVKSSGHSSLNESVSGEAWSSEDEVDEANGETIKMKDTSLPQQPAPRSRREDLGVMISDDRMSYVEVGASSSSSVLQTASLSGGVSYGADPNFKVTQEKSQSSPLDLTVPPVRRLRRSHEFKETEESGHSKVPTKPTEEWREQSVDVGQSGLKIDSEVTDVEVKQRKLQRTTQVLHERYDEWEDAYRREREQRKVDEIFMREALAEAQKAAGSWEVPVGAVLVQNGNVIARGYNLVEELRDSTAHAEMICIREGSNVLQTWRLSETTLYVTLEPCPMCAGAILQARVGTLVWGAPNKLLGADGSWIRLFPDGLAGEERQEVADKPAAPAHPFHPNMKIRRGVLEPECAYIMQQFFQLRRREEKSSQEPTQRPKLLHKIFKFPPIHRKRSS